MSDLNKCLDLANAVCCYCTITFTTFSNTFLNLVAQGKFYELYELDAEIGHKEMDWKLTYSGVGKCRQVSSVMIALLQVLKSPESWYDFQAKYSNFVDCGKVIV